MMCMCNTWHHGALVTVQNSDCYYSITNNAMAIFSAGPSLRSYFTGLFQRQFSKGEEKLASQCAIDSIEGKLCQEMLFATQGPIQMPCKS